jgi:MFS family permease
MTFPHDEESSSPDPAFNNLEREKEEDDDAILTTGAEPLLGPSPDVRTTSTSTPEDPPDSPPPLRTTVQVKVKQPEAIGWMDLPRKQQLIVIVLARLSEPLVQTSLQSYMFYQLKWFDPTLPDSVISSQAGMLHASFTAAQFLTAMLWGRVADSAYFGRKTVLMIGLTGASMFASHGLRISRNDGLTIQLVLSVLGFGFSTKFWQALLFRSLGGITNGNVGVLRTMISEIVREKKYQSRAFILLPMTYNIGVIIGPILGGILADPAHSYPSLFGHVKFFQVFPYALPNLLGAVFLFSAVLSVWLNLEEVSAGPLKALLVGRN